MIANPRTLHISQSATVRGLTVINTSTNLPLYYIARYNTPNRPNVVIHGGDNTTSPRLGSVRLDRPCRGEFQVCFGDERRGQWEGVRQRIEDGRQVWNFSSSFFWRSVHKKRILSFRGGEDYELCRRPTGEGEEVLLGRYQRNGTLSFVDDGGVGEGMEVRCLAVLAGLLEQARRKRRFPANSPETTSAVN